MFSSLIMFIAASTLVFDKDVAGKKTEVSWQIMDKGKELEILGSNDGKITEIFCDLAFHFSKYIAKTKGNEQFSVDREGDTLIVTKQTGENTKQQNYDIGKKNWVQDFSFGLRPFFMSSATEHKFEIINPKDLVMRTMVATKEEIEMKVFNGVEYRAQKVKVTLDGYYRKFWKAELWFDTKTHNLLYYKANEGPSTPYTILTIKELKK